MTKIEMLNKTLKKYKELKEAHYNSLWLAQRAIKNNDNKLAEALKQMANEYWVACNEIESLANIIFPNVDFFELYLDTI